jgi:hypothetical protein
MKKRKFFMGTFFKVLISILILSSIILLNGCSSSSYIYDFRPQFTQSKILPDRQKISDHGIKSIKTFIKAYVKIGELEPYQEKVEHYKEFNESGNLLQEIYYINDDKYYDKEYLYTYNKDEVLIEKSSFLLPYRTKQNIDYKLDKNGKCIEEVRKDEKGKTTSTTKTNYNKSGRKVEVIEYEGTNNPIEKFLYEYDYNGNNTLIEYYSPFNILVTKKVFKYDSLNNLIFEAEYDKSSKENYKYNYKIGKNNTVDTTEYYSESTGKIIYIFHRDEDGYIRTIDGFNSKGDKYCKYRYEYTYFYSMDKFMVNSTIVPTSRYRFEGQLTAGFKQSLSKYFTIKNFQKENLKCEMTWKTPYGEEKMIEGVVQVTPKKLGVKNLACPLIMDYSGSMGEQDRMDIQNAAGMFVEKMDGNDEAQIIKFNVTLKTKTGFTNSKRELINAINDANDLKNFTGGTALHYAILTGVENVKNKNPLEYLRSVVCMTDGAENSSKTGSREDLLRIAINNGITVYTILYGEDELDKKCKGHHDPPVADGNYCEWDMWDIATKTGGFYFFAPKNSDDIQDIYNSIIGQLGNTFDLVITWPESGNLPASGTMVTVSITVIYRGKTEKIYRTFPMP